MNDPGARGGVLLAGVLLVCGLGALVLSVYVLSLPTMGGTINATLVVTEALSGDDTGFERVLGPRTLSFPEDHGPHTDFRTEWWYVTGNVETGEGRRFGFQLTFFRNAAAPAPADRASAWNTNQVYMAHFAVTDVQSNEHHAFERLARGAMGLAGAQPSPFRVWLEDWSLEGAAGGLLPLRLSAMEAGFGLDLTLQANKPVVLQGDRGFSPKGPEEGNASHYYSYTRLEAQGSVRIPGATMEVSGLAWMDREWGTSVLSEGVEGWDWFALHLTDGREIMFYHLRAAEDRPSGYGGGLLIDTDGTTRMLGRDQLDLEVLDRWASPLDGAEYPSAWRVTVPDERLAVEIVPLVADQEMNVSFRYWEGAVEVRGVWGLDSVIGSGYAELTGYGGPAPLR